MERNKIGESARKMIFASVVTCITIFTLVLFANSNRSSAAGETTNASAKNVSPQSPTAVFPGTGTGAIPDATACGPTPGTPLNVSFAVTGISGAPASVVVDMAIGSPNHTWMGDIIATLIAPNGTSATVFGRTGATTGTGIGDASDLGGTYTFSDAAGAPPSGGWWQEAAVQGTAALMTAGTYRSTAAGGAGAVNPQPPTSLNSAFSAIPTSNGTWTLRFTDGCGGDTANVTAANLTLTGATPPVAKPLDFNGDGKTDYSVVRNTGGGPSGQATWYNCFNGIAEPACYQFANWGIASDFFVPADYDGDGKSDIAVWRPGTPAFYIIFNSATSTVTTDNFGQTGDDPSVVADYTGDGKADEAVYRAGVNPGDQSFWYYRASSGVFSGSIVFEQWGQNGDFVSPGDYNGDGKADFVIQRNAGGGQAIFWLRTNGTNVITNVVFGTPTDLIVPGDYDGDGKTDIAVVRGSGGQVHWFYLASATSNVIFGGPFGLSATDYVVQGDYDGDGKTDIAVWRPAVDFTANFFYFLGSTSGFNYYEWGQSGDFPVANYNSH